MVFESITGYFAGVIAPAIAGGGINIAFLFVVFVMFVVLAKKVWGMVKNMVFISAAAIAFPFVINFSGYASIPITFASMSFFVVLGIGSYLAYVVANAIFKFTKIFGRGSKKVVYQYKQK